MECGCGHALSLVFYFCPHQSYARVLVVIVTAAIGPTPSPPFICLKTDYSNKFTFIVVIATSAISIGLVCKIESYVLVLWGLVDHV